MKKIIFILILLIFISGCVQINNFEDCVNAGNPVMESYPRQCKTEDGRIFVEEIREGCNDDSDCNKAGCSGQICTTKEKAKDIVTTCEWKDEYECYKLTSCGCVNNKCQWKENQEFDQCLTNY